MRPVCLFTDFGHDGPYIGQMKAALYRCQPQVPVIDLMADAPSFQPQAAAYLVAALLEHTPENAVILGVVDPGVGGTRLPLVVEVGRRILIGPDNGLLAVAWRHGGGQGLARVISWRPPRLSASFHGRDLFAPVAAALAAGQDVAACCGADVVPLGADWPDDLDRVIYIDHYGNAMTGIRGHRLGRDHVLRLGQACLPWARTFSDVRQGQAFWYVNSIGLVEISVNCGHAGRQIPVSIGDKVC